MEIIRKPADLRRYAEEVRKDGRTVGFVPTMGYLHEGHLSLVRQARRDNGAVIVSIFVNPIQFGPTEDLAAYPRDMDRDAEMCLGAGADVIFAPEPADMYPDGWQTHVEVERLTRGLCGAARPGHFRGVATVVAKLFNIVGPCRAYFGQKDAQQLAVIRRMVMDLNMPVEVIGMPIVRESDGLAMSSRNTYLNQRERQAALVLHRSLNHAAGLLARGERNAGCVAGEIRSVIESEPLAAIDYVQVVDAAGLEPVHSIEAPVLIALAVKVGRTRLIDNMTWDPSRPSTEV